MKSRANARMNPKPDGKFKVNRPATIVNIPRHTHTVAEKMLIKF